MKKQWQEGMSLEELYYIYLKKKDKYRELLGLTSLGIPISTFFFDDINLMASSILSMILLNIYKGIDIVDCLLKYNDYYLASSDYNNANQMYNILLKEIIKLFHNLDCDNEMKIFAGYSYMLRKGYLSLEHEFYYDPDINSSFYFLGSNVVLGYGNCKHINTFLTDLLKEDGYNCYNICMRINSEIKSLNNNFLKKSSKKTLKRDDLSWKLFKLFYNLYSKNPNHLATLFYKNNYSYIMDATNNAIFSIDHEKNIVQKDKHFLIKDEKIFNKNQKIDLDTILLPTKKEELKILLNDYYQIFNMFLECDDILEKFYLEHKELYQDILTRRRILIKETEHYSIR